MLKMVSLAILIVDGVAGLVAVSLPYSGMRNDSVGNVVASIANVFCQPLGWPCQRTYDVSAKTSNGTFWVMAFRIQLVLALRSPPLSMWSTVLMVGSTSLTAWM